MGAMDGAVDEVGELEGVSVGDEEGTEEGVSVGDTDGSVEIVGVEDGNSVGWILVDGPSVGSLVGSNERVGVGASVSGFSFSHSLSVASQQVSFLGSHSRSH